MKLKTLNTSKGKIFQFRCPGCATDHAVDESWSFNNSFEKPTFHPSILYREYEGEKISHICHSYVTDGFIRYLDDCTHNLKGQTVALPEL